ncbi:hypothetical protein BX286_0216 [Streptomyces sp. 3211.6]|nr:hypothetical protein [Streptomyces sp. 3211.6]RKT02323.1 hypothetical protein BX286_0216 [Streptomyces sp. 3211.6]
MALFYLLLIAAIVLIIIGATVDGMLYRSPPACSCSSPTSSTSP